MRLPSSLERPCTQPRAPEYKQQDFAVVSEAELPVKAERRDEVAEVGAVEVVEVEAVVEGVVEEEVEKVEVAGAAASLRLVAVEAGVVGLDVLERVERQRQAVSRGQRDWR